ncbi:MAG: hypothetical protein IPK23_05835 [Rhizobiales bacterium]|nr:hypothetical protein [Hyphomicrobiales bacterium]
MGISLLTRELVLERRVTGGNPSNLDFGCAAESRTCEQKSRAKKTVSKRQRDRKGPLRERIGERFFDQSRNLGAKLLSISHAMRSQHGAIAKFAFLYNASFAIHACKSAQTRSSNKIRSVY